MSKTPYAMQRHLMGALALIFLSVGVSLLLIWPQKSNSGFVVASVCWRVGLVLAVGWLAFPQLAKLFARTPSWMLPLAAIALMTIVVRPRWLWLIAPVLLALLALQALGAALRPRRRR